MYLVERDSVSVALPVALPHRQCVARMVSRTASSFETASAQFRIVPQSSAQFCKVPRFRKVPQVVHESRLARMKISGFPQTLLQCAPHPLVVH